MLYAKLHCGHSANVLLIRRPSVPCLVEAYCESLASGLHQAEGPGCLRAASSLAKMSVSKTSKLLNYINYSKLLPACDEKLAKWDCDLGCPGFPI